MTRSSARLSGAASAVAIVTVAVAGLAAPATADAIKKPGRYYGGASSQRHALSYALTRNASPDVPEGGRSPTRTRPARRRPSPAG